MRSDPPAAPVDILDALLSDPDGCNTADCPDFAGAFPGQEALARLIRRAAAPAPTPLRSVPRPQAAPPKAAPAAAPEARETAPNRRIMTRKRATHYLDAATHERLGRAKDALSRLAQDHAAWGRVSRSRIVEAALRDLLGEFEAKGQNSRLCRSLEKTAPKA